MVTRTTAQTTIQTSVVICGNIILLAGDDLSHRLLLQIRCAGVLVRRVHLIPRADIRDTSFVSCNDHFYILWNLATGVAARAGTTTRAFLRKNDFADSVF